MLELFSLSRLSCSISLHFCLDCTEAFNSILALHLVLPLDEYLFRRKSEFPLLPSAWYITNGVCNEESCCLINPVCSGTACCCSHSRGAAANESPPDGVPTFSLS